MILKHFYALILLFYSLSILSTEFIVIAQQQNVYEQVDTIKITNDPESMILIIKVDTFKIKWESGFRDMINHIEVYDYSNKELIQTINDSSESYSFAGGVDYVDINLDGYLDIDILLGISNLTPFHSFWLFDKLNNKFYSSPDFSQLNEYDIDVDKKEIDSYSQSTGGRGGYSEKFKIENGNLFLIEKEYSNYFDYERQEIINGVLRTVELIEEEWLTDDDKGNGTSIINTYKLFYDSLLLTEKSWMTDLNGEDASKYNSDTYYCGPWGECIKYLRKEVYSYNINDGRLTQEILKYQVINNKWTKVEDFIE